MGLPWQSSGWEFVFQCQQYGCGQGAEIPTCFAAKNQNAKQKQYCYKFNKDFNNDTKLKRQKEIDSDRVLEVVATELANGLAVEGEGRRDIKT